MIFHINVFAPSALVGKEIGAQCVCRFKRISFPAETLIEIPTHRDCIRPGRLIFIVRPFWISVGEQIPHELPGVLQANGDLFIAARAL